MMLRASPYLRVLDGKRLGRIEKSAVHRKEAVKHHVGHPRVVLGGHAEHVLHLCIYISVQRADQIKCAIIQATKQFNQITILRIEPFFGLAPPVASHRQLGHEDDQAEHHESPKEGRQRRHKAEPQDGRSRHQTHPASKWPDK